MHPQQAAQRRRDRARRREAARLARGSRQALTRPLPTISVDGLTEAVRAMTEMAAHLNRTVAAMALPGLRVGGDFETEERLARFRDSLRPYELRPVHLDEAIDAARALCRQLGPRRWTSLTFEGWVLVRGGTTGEYYRVDCAPPGNIIRRSDNMRMCLAHPSPVVPVAALLSCQIFLIERDEPRFLNGANYLGIVSGYHDRISPWIIEEACYPGHPHPVRIEPQLRPRREITARVPVTPMLTPDMVHGVPREQLANEPPVGLLRSGLS